MGAAISNGQGQLRLDSIYVYILTMFNNVKSIQQCANIRDFAFKSQLVEKWESISVISCKTVFMRITPEVKRVRLPNLKHSPFNIENSKLSTNSTHRLKLKRRNPHRKQPAGQMPQSFRALELAADEYIEGGIIFHAGHLTLRES